MSRSLIASYPMNICRVFMNDQDHHEQALATAERLLGHPLVLPLAPA